ncbi:ParB/RepB/Spo0J family partition protein [Nocardia fluminea]
MNKAGPACSTGFPHGGEYPRLQHPGRHYGELKHLPIGPMLVENPLVARRRIDELEGLVISIRHKGILQPLIVGRAAAFRLARPDAQLPPGAEFVVVAGHRRYAAARLAGLATVPAIIRDDVVAKADNVVVSLVENVHRAKLVPLEEARMLAVLRDLGLTQREICERTGVSQGQVSKRLRLLDLPISLQDEIEEGSLTVIDALTVLQNLSDPAQQQRCVALSQQHSRSVRSVLRQLEREPAAPPRSPDPKPEPVAGSRNNAPTPHLAPVPSPAPPQVPDLELLKGPDVSALHAASAQARATACQLLVQRGLAGRFATELLMDLALDPPIARSADAVQAARMVAQRWTRSIPVKDIEREPTDAELACAELAAAGLAPSDLAGAIALAHREIDLKFAAPLNRPWRRSARRHISRLARWGVHEPSSYELARLEEPEEPNHHIESC